MILTLNGRSQTSGLWAKEIGIGESVILNRLRIGWTHERALTTPTDHRRMTSKSVFERHLDDTKVEKLPKDMQEAYEEGNETLKPMNRVLNDNRKGDWFRRNHPRMFDRYYREYLESA